MPRSRIRRTRFGRPRRRAARRGTLRRRLVRRMMPRRYDKPEIKIAYTNLAPTAVPAGTSNAWLMSPTIPQGTQLNQRVGSSLRTRKVTISGYIEIQQIRGTQGVGGTYPTDEHLKLVRFTCWVPRITSAQSIAEIQNTQAFATVPFPVATIMKDRMMFLSDYMSYPPALQPAGDSLIRNGDAPSIYMIKKTFLFPRKITYRDPAGAQTDLEDSDRFYIGVINYSNVACRIACIASWFFTDA